MFLGIVLVTTRACKEVSRQASMRMPGVARLHGAPRDELEAQQLLVALVHAREQLLILDLQLVHVNRAQRIRAVVAARQHGRQPPHRRLARSRIDIPGVWKAHFHARCCSVADGCCAR